MDNTFVIKYKENNELKGWGTYKSMVLANFGLYQVFKENNPESVYVERYFNSGVTTHNPNEWLSRVKGKELKETWLIVKPAELTIDQWVNARYNINLQCIDTGGYVAYHPSILADKLCGVGKSAEEAIADLFRNRIKLYDHVLTWQPPNYIHILVEKH